MDLDTLDQEIANHPMKNAAPWSSKVNHIDRNTFIPEVDDLQDLKWTYKQNGGRDPEFIQKVRDLEDFV